METQTEFNFKRKARIGVNPIAIPDRGTIAVKVLSNVVGSFERKNDEPIPFVEVCDLKTGETGHLWLSGQLKYQFSEMQKVNRLEGAMVEIVHKGKKAWKTPDGETANVNEYDLFELE